MQKIHGATQYFSITHLNSFHRSGVPCIFTWQIPFRFTISHLWFLPHRGIIMYVMVVGKFPFSSPYHDHARRQRLLNQINRGLQAKHERDMEHLSSGNDKVLLRNFCFKSVLSFRIQLCICIYSMQWHFESGINLPLLRSVPCVIHVC